MFFPGQATVYGPCFAAFISNIPADSKNSLFLPNHNPLECLKAVFRAQSEIHDTEVLLPVNRMFPALSANYFWELYYRSANVIRYRAACLFYNSRWIFASIYKRWGGRICFIFPFIIRCIGIFMNTLLRPPLWLLGDTINKFFMR